MDESKTCARCGAQKLREDFPPARRRRDGRFPYCRDCKREADRAHHAANRERRTEAMRSNYRRNPEPYKARAAAAYRANPEQGKAKAARWAAANPERVREIRRACDRRLYELNPERKREVWRRRQAAIRRGCLVYPFTLDQLAAKVAYWGARCWVCSGPYEAVDHVKPLAKQGPHMLANLRPICTGCNSRKRDRWPLP